MRLNEYKNSIKNIIDSTQNETLLKHWKRQLEWDIQHQEEIELSQQEWNLVQEGIADYEKGDVLTLEEFLHKR
jgi:sulfur relay (sulfurtransferase) DsrC/TusE family protein